MHANASRSLNREGANDSTDVSSRLGQIEYNLFMPILPKNHARSNGLHFEFSSPLQPQTGAGA
jgi:hypothetical protein